ncbi:MAG: class III poly(R)-hydroxyalkanoic acid synthase subunit PhaE [Synechocystis sp.]|nr:class III poly(R)-hydroxyalkanoic acid synthase subunit PhaE [Synechocystis sp.]
METTNKTWTEMMTPFSQFWLESSSQAWKNWFELMEKGISTQGSSPASPGFESLPQQFLQSQQFYGQLLKHSFEAWQSLWPQLGNPIQANPAIQAYLQQLQQQIQAYTANTQTLQGDLDNLWQCYLKEVQKFSQLWLSTWQSSLSPLSQMPQNGVHSWLELNNLYWEAIYDKNLGSFMRSPLLGPSREINGQLLRAFDDWVALYRAMNDYQLLEADIQYRGLVALTEQLVERTQQNKPIKTWREFQQVWAIAADQVFEDAFCEEKNLKIRGRFINALNRYRIQQQALLEEWLKTFNLPTRSEVDEIHQTIYQLRKEMKQLKKRLAQYETPPA